MAHAFPLIAMSRILGATLAIDIESELEHKESLWLKAPQVQDAPVRFI